MLELTAPQRRIVEAILAKRVPDRDVRAFGSRVAGGARRWSDLDLVVMGDKPLPDLVRAQLVADFEDSDLPFRVDTVELRDLPAAWRQQIETHSVQVQKGRAS
jgi:type I restriction enzyme S subunit